VLGDSTWGFTYVAHGVAGVALVGLVIAHVYFAVRPEKWWITKSMILGWVSRRNYLEHHDPARWKVRSGRVCARDQPIWKRRALSSTLGATPSKNATSSCSPMRDRGSRTSSRAARAARS